MKNWKKWLCALACFACMSALTACGFGAEEKLTDMAFVGNEMIVYLSDDLSDLQARAMATQFNQIDGVYSVEFVSGEQALEEFKKHTDADFSGVDVTVLRHRYVVTVESEDQIPGVKEQLEQIDGVEEVKIPNLALFLE